MRISSGQYKGKEIANVRSAKSHPMSERLRNALFNALGDITGLEILDAFGGSGALGFEALSRGAKRVTICEIDKKTYRRIEKNTKILGLESKTKLVNRNVYSFLNDSSEKFDLVFVDPPFLEYAELKINPFVKVLKHNSVLVVSCPSNASETDHPYLRLVKHSKHGDAALTFFKLNKA